MAITFALRGDSLTPRYNGSGGPDYGIAGQTTQISADAGAIGGSVIDMDIGSVANMQLVYAGVNNWPNTKTVSVLIRAKFGAVSGTLGLFNCSGPTRACNGQLALNINGSDFRAYMRNSGGQLGINNTVIGAHGLSTGTWYDIVATYDGTNGADGFEVFVDASSVGTATSSRSWNTARHKVYSGLELGRGGDNVNNTQMVVNEFVVWDEIIDPTSVTLTSGSGSLNGSSRTAFVDVAEQDGSASTGGGSGPFVGPGSIGY